MRVLSYRDVPLLRSAGFKAGFSGHSWFGRDKAGDVWQAVEETAQPQLVFISPSRESLMLTREDFDQMFTT